MTWTIYTFGDGDLLANVLNAVALLTNGALGSLTRAAALVGLLAALGMVAARAIDWPRFAGWFAGFALIFAALVQLRVTVAVEDVVDSRIAPQVVGDVPFIVALPAAVASQVSYQLTNLATALQLNGELGGDVLLRPTANVQALLESALAPGDLHANLVNYLHDCVVREGSGISQVNAANDPDLFAAIQSNNFANMLPLIVNGQEAPNAISCADMYTTVLAPRLAPPTEGQDVGLDAALRGLKCRLLGGRSLVTPGGSVPPCGAGPLSDAWAALQPALEAVHLDNLGTVTPEQVFTTVLIAKAWHEAQMDLAREHQDPASAMAIANDALLKQLEIQAQTGREVAKAGLLRQIRALADGLVYLGAPILLALGVTPFVWRALGLYVRLFVWLMLWGPIQAIVHFIVLGVAASDVSGAGVAVTLGTLDDVYRQIVQANATGYDVMIAVPGLALALAWGGVGAIGGVLGGAAGGVLSAGTGLRQRVEAGEEVVASSYAKSAAIADPLKRPPNMTGLGTQDWQAYWNTAAVTRSLSGTTVRPGDGRTVTALRDGSVKIVSPTQELAVSPAGHKSGWQLLDQTVTVRTPQGSYALPQGAFVRWTGNGVEADLPSQKDPLTHQPVKPRGVFAQDPNAPGGFGALTQKLWTVTSGGLTYQAAQGADGIIAYNIAGRTDFEVVRDGKLVPATGDVRGTALAIPDGKGGYDIRPAQSQMDYLTQNGERRVEQGTLTPPGVLMTGRQWMDRFGPAAQGTPYAVHWAQHPDTLVSGPPIFQPYAGTASNAVTTQRVERVQVGPASGTLSAEARTAQDGATVTDTTVTLDNGMQFRVLIPSDAKPSPDGKVTVSGFVDGVLRGVTIRGGGLPSAPADLPLNRVPFTMRLTPEEAKNPNPETLARAIAGAQVQPFTAYVPDPGDPTKTMQVGINRLLPFGSISGRVDVRSIAVDGQEYVFPPNPDDRADQGADGLQPHGKPLADASYAKSSTTNPIWIRPGRDGWKGHIEVVGETATAFTEDGRQQLTAHRAPMYFVAQDGVRHFLGYGNVTAVRDGNGEWVAQTLDAQEGVSILQNNLLRAHETRQAAPGVFADVRKTVDPATGQVVSQEATIGVTQENAEAVRRAFGGGPVQMQPGGTFTIANDGLVRYEGPAAVKMTMPHPETGQPTTVTAPVQARLEGTLDPQTRKARFSSGSFGAVLQGEASTAALPEWAQRRLQDQIGQQGKAAIALAPDGRSLRLDIQAGDTTKAFSNVTSVEQHTRSMKISTLDLDPQSVRNLALNKDPRLAMEVLNPLPGTTQEQRALAQVGALTESLQRFLERRGISDDAFKSQFDLAALKEVVRKRVEKAAGQLGNAKLGDAKVSEIVEKVFDSIQPFTVSYTSQDHKTVNLLAARGLAVYYTADKLAAEAAAGAPNDPNAYHRTFTEVYAKGLQEVAGEAIGEVKGANPWEYGAIGPAARLVNDAAGWLNQVWEGVKGSPDGLTGKAARQSPGAGEAASPSDPGESPVAGPFGGLFNLPAAQAPGRPQPERSASSVPPPSGPPSAGNWAPGLSSPETPGGSQELTKYLRDRPPLHAALATSLAQYVRGELPEPLFQEQVESAILAYHRTRSSNLDAVMPQAKREAAAFLDQARQARDYGQQRRNGPPSGSASRAPEMSEGDGGGASAASAPPPKDSGPDGAGTSAPPNAPGAVASSRDRAASQGSSAASPATLADVVDRLPEKERGPFWAAMETHGKLYRQGRYDEGELRAGVGLTLGSYFPQLDAGARERLANAIVERFGASGPAGSAPKASDGRGDGASSVPAPSPAQPAPAPQPSLEKPNRSSAGRPSEPAQPAVPPPAAESARTGSGSGEAAGPRSSPPAPSLESRAPRDGGTASAPSDVRERAGDLFAKMERYGPLVERYNRGELTREQLMDRIYEADPAVLGKRLYMTGLVEPLDFRTYRPSGKF